MKLSTAVSFLSSAMALSATSVVIAAPMGTGRIIMTNLAPNQGIFFTPFWVAIHDGNFDIYDRDMPASMELERLAEDGTTGDISALFDAGNTAGNVFDATIANPPPFPGPIAPGATVELEFTLTADDIDENLYFSYASMIVPSVRWIVFVFLDGDVLELLFVSLVARLTFVVGCCCCCSCCFFFFIMTTAERRLRSQW